MNAVTVSPKFQVVMALAVRQSLGIKAGSKLAVLEYDGRIQLIPIQPIERMYGFLKGMNTDLPDEPDRL